MGMSSGISSAAAPSAITSPTDTQGSTSKYSIKALPPTPPFMSPLPEPSLDISAPPHERSQSIGTAELSATMLVNDAGLFDLTNMFRFFLVGTTRRWKEKCGLHVERIRESTKPLISIICTGKVSGIKLRHEGESVSHATSLSCISS